MNPEDFGGENISASELSLKKKEIKQEEEERVLFGNEEIKNKFLDT